MKPNLIVVQPPDFPFDAAVEQFCEGLCDSHYVYLIRPNSDFREDSAAGVRFLGHALDCLPRFGSVDTAIAVGDSKLAEILKNQYPESSLGIWHPSGNLYKTYEINDLLNPTVVRGEFGAVLDRDFAKAM